MKIIILFLFILLLSNLAIARELSPSIEWEREFDSGMDDSLFDILPLNDGGFILAGTKYLPESNTYGIWLVKLNSNGNKIWEKTIEKHFGKLHTHIIQIEEEYILSAYDKYPSGYPFWGEEHIWLLKLDSEGELIWEKKFDDPGPLEGWTFYSDSIMIDSYDNFLMSVRTTHPYYTEGHAYDVGSIFKLDPEGNLILSVSYGNGANGWQQWGYKGRTAIVSTDEDNGGYILCGHAIPVTSSGMYYYQGFDNWVIKTDLNGERIWDTTIDKGREEFTTNCQTLNNKEGYFVAGYTSSYRGEDFDFWLFKLDNQGNFINGFNYGGNGKDILHDALQSTDGGFILAGESNSSSENIESLVIKTNYAGEVLWEKSFNKNKTNRIYSVKETSEGYIVGGEILNSNENLDYFVLKLNRDPFNCSPDWVCSNYKGECVFGLKNCISVTDFNSCGKEYEGNYSEFQQECTYCGDGVIQNLNGNNEPEECDNDREARSCGSNIGECKEGTQTRQCSSECTWEEWSQCDDIPSEDEICDELDNDCNGEVDNGLICANYDLQIYSPTDIITYNTTKIQFNITASDLLDKIFYIDLSEPKPKNITLCSNCDEYGFIKKKTKSFKEGQYNLTIKGIKDDELIEENVSFFIDSKKPKISKTEPKTNSYTNGSRLLVKYTEDNVERIEFEANELCEDPLNCSSLYSTTNSCQSGKDQECIFDIDILNLNGNKFEYAFKITDIVNNTAQSTKIKAIADTTSPVITSFNNSIQGTKVEFILNITELNFDEINYIDWNEISPKEKILCSNLKNGVCKVKKTFKTGEHSLTISVLDKAGNSVKERVDFAI